MAVTIIPATFIKITDYKHNDANETILLCGINLNTGVAVAECYRVNKDLTKELIGQGAAFGKDDSVCGIVYNNGTVRMFVSEADLSNMGNTSAVRVYDFPGKFPTSQVASGTTDAFIRLQFKNFLIGLRDLANKIIALIP